MSTRNPHFERQWVEYAKHIESQITEERTPVEVRLLRKIARQARAGGRIADKATGQPEPPEWDPSWQSRMRPHYEYFRLHRRDAKTARFRRQMTWEQRLENCYQPPPPLKTFTDYTNPYGFDITAHSELATEIAHIRAHINDLHIICGHDQSGGAVVGARSLKPAPAGSSPAAASGPIKRAVVLLGRLKGK